MKNPANLLTHTLATKRNRHRGFTLVELMVVIAIIAVLALLAFASARRVKEMAQQANALSALRQVATASVAYSVENNGEINILRYGPPSGTDPLEGNNTPQPGGDAWVRNTFWGRLQPFLFADISITNQSDLGKELKKRLDQLLISPDSNTMKNTVISGAKVYRDDSGLAVPFGFNKNPLVYKFGEAKKTSGITDPSQILYMTMGYDRFDENAGKAYAPLPTDGTSKPIYFLENQNALGTFIDGHVEVLKAPIASRKFK